MEIAMRCGLIAVVALLGSTTVPGFFTTANAAEATELPLNLRKRVEVAPETKRWNTITTPTAWNPKQTAVVICDMWDKHWCPNSTIRVAEMAPRMNEVVKAARSRGAFIIHCPS